MAIVFLMNRTEPSAKPTFAPPEWKLLSPMMIGAESKSPCPV